MRITTLDKPLAEIGFVKRESRGGRPVSFKCGRDFLYYALNFYFPEDFNAEKNNPFQIDRQKFFGVPMSKFLAWTQLQFCRVPTFFKSRGLSLYINSRHISSYGDFVAAILVSRMSFLSAIDRIEKCVRSNTACAVDMPVGQGLLAVVDHVMFVYGYDAEYLYVVDTHNVPYVDYESLDESRDYYRLPKKEIEKNWSVFGRVWEVRRSAS